MFFLTQFPAVGLLLSPQAYLQIIQVRIRNVPFSGIIHRDRRGYLVLSTDERLFSPEKLLVFCFYGAFAVISIPQTVFQFIISTICSPFQFRVDGQVITLFRLDRRCVDAVQRNMCLRQPDHPHIPIDSGTAVPSAVGRLKYNTQNDFIVSLM